MAKSENAPVHSVRYGNIKAAVWVNQTNCGPMYNVTIARSYRSGEEWRTSASFGVRDLLSAAKALNEAHSWIIGKLRAGAQSSARPAQRRATG